MLTFCILSVLDVWTPLREGLKDIERMRSTLAMVLRMVPDQRRLRVPMIRTTCLPSLCQFSSLICRERRRYYAGFGSVGVDEVGPHFENPVAAKQTRVGIECGSGILTFRVEYVDDGSKKRTLKRTQMKSRSS